MEDTKAPVYTAPFFMYPHIIRSADGVYTELACPACGGNARGDSPYAFIGRVGDFAKHARGVHNRAVERDDFLASHTFRQLTEDDVEAIRAGEGEGVIQRKPFVKIDGHLAVSKTSRP